MCGFLTQDSMAARMTSVARTVPRMKTVILEEVVGTAGLVPFMEASTARDRILLHVEQIKIDPN